MGTEQAGVLFSFVVAPIQSLAFSSSLHVYLPTFLPFPFDANSAWQLYFTFLFTPFFFA
jgi:hypothetical protein